MGGGGHGREVPERMTALRTRGPELSEHDSARLGHHGHAPVGASASMHASPLKIPPAWTNVSTCAVVSGFGVEVARREPAPELAEGLCLIGVLYAFGHGAQSRCGQG